MKDPKSARKNHPERANPESATVIAGTIDLESSEAGEAPPPRAVRTSRPPPPPPPRIAAGTPAAAHPLAPRTTTLTGAGVYGYTRKRPLSAGQADDASMSAIAGDDFEDVPTVDAGPMIAAAAATMMVQDAVPTGAPDAEAPATGVDATVAATGVDAVTGVDATVAATGEGAVSGLTGGGRAGDTAGVTPGATGGGHTPGATGTGGAMTAQTSSPPTFIDTDREDMLPVPGERIEQYELIRELGRGGMGAVFLARDTKLARRVAIKFLHTDNQEVAVRFLLEAKVTAQFNHGNIVTIYSQGEYKGHQYMVLEFLEGQPLTGLISKGKRLPVGRTVQLMVPVVRGLVTAHAHNVVHRDLKPDNIFLTSEGIVKVLDFGIAKLKGLDLGVDELVQRFEQRDPAALEGEIPKNLENTQDTNSTDLTRQGALMGTLAYMSPEQWGMGEVDHQTDIWAMGILMYRILAGHHPLAPLRGWQLAVTANFDQPMPSIREAVPGIPPELALVIDRCLLKNKAERIQTAEDLLRALEPFLPGRYTKQLAIDESPYAGLRAFQEDDADRFFGRGREIAAMVTQLRDRPLMGVVGPSGVGKSSFVRAGVVPALKQSGEKWETLVVRPGRDPMAALSHLVAPMVGSTSTTVAEDISEQQATQRRLMTEPGYLGSILRSRARRADTKVLLFIDQFEELYTLTEDPVARRAFTQCLAGVADDATAPLRVVLSIRSDFLDRVAEDPGFMSQLMQGLFFLMPPSRDGLRDALVQPAEMCAYHFETANMVEDMLSHLETTPGALPLLQFAATKLWELKDSGRKLLTEHSYQQIGGIVGALASHADSVLGEMSAPAQALVKSISLRLVTPERTRAIVSVSELHELSKDPAEVRRVVDQLVQARLLVVQTGEAGPGRGATGEATVEIVHESLIHGWPTLRRWLDENQEDAAFLDQLRTAAKQWQARGYPAGLLWRGETMEDAKRWYRSYRGQLPQLQQAYLKAVFALAQRSSRRKRAAIVATISVLSLMLVAALFLMLKTRAAEKDAVAQREEAQKQATLATSAEADAKEKLALAEERERQRLAAEAKRVEAEEEAALANREVERSWEELEVKNEALTVALKRATRAKRRYRKAKQVAEQNADAAESARRATAAAKSELENEYEREKKRVQELLDQLGSELVEDLE